MITNIRPNTVVSWVTGEATLLSLVKDKGRLYLSSLQIISKDDGKLKGIGVSAPLGHFFPPITPRRQIYRSCQKNNMYQVSTIIDSLARRVVVLILSVVADVAL